nr:MAG TPA: hypothetical protein [Caudoviricetes sp.]
MDKSSRLLSGHSEGLILRSVLTWAVSHLFSDNLGLLLIQRCDARFHLFGSQRALVSLESHFVLNCKAIIA